MRRNPSAGLVVLTGSIALGAATLLAASPASAQCVCPAPTTTLTDSTGFIWDVNANGQTCNGTGDSYDAGQALVVDGVYFPAMLSVTTELAGRQVVIGPTTMSG